VKTHARNGRAVDWLIAGLATGMCVACILWNVKAPTRMGVAILTQQYMALQLGLALTIAYLRFGWKGDEKKHVGWIDGTAAVIVFIVLLYAAWNFSWLLQEQYYRPWQIVVIGTVVTVAVMEGVRRRAGWMLFAIVLVFLVYALLADKVPGRLIGKEMDPVRLVSYLGFDPSAVFSMPLAVGTIIVLLFVFSGSCFSRPVAVRSSPISRWPPRVAREAAVQKFRWWDRRSSDRFPAARCPTSLRRASSPSR
jgi:TRAP-type uncharacterized transport system fused permease subunit